MYVTILELADYLGLPSEYIEQQIQLGHVKAVFDGGQFLVNIEQFAWHKEQIDKKRRQLAAEEEDPIPEDWDAKDED
ncbi:excisionase family DNA-binding protein [Halalkalibacter nanhaiisediminis]|uniref:Glucose-6-phosphate isomerase n=1 Tax=Halalkalibacter nanhaiisediminis TaxID=688079 RepID=A0A562Q997_9BACI|nr:excisionase family DNA-binding protein [Halalkalibacter nanhaiisediminis]TWI53303.1 glucose-6-phosphate isomerase [Halalkalibacter nanhaiisediminis]